MSAHTKSKHPHVAIKKRERSTGTVWRAVYTDPDKGKRVYYTLEGTKDARELWAKRKSEAIAARRAELAHGAQRVEALPVADAMKLYLASAQHRLRPRTLVIYRLALDAFTAWCATNKIKSTRDLNRARLTQWRDYLIAKPHRSVVQGGKRGERAEGEKQRSAASINRELRTTKTILNTWRTSGWVALTGDDLRDCLKPLRGKREQPEYMKPAPLRKLLQAVVRHDADTYEETRDEHRGARPKGTTHRHVPIAAFTTLLLLAGMRRGEALALKWSDVDLDALDAEGRPVGELRVRAEISKTHAARTVGLDHAPMLRAILAKLRLRAGDECEDHFVFGGAEGYSEDVVEAARRRLCGEGESTQEPSGKTRRAGYGAPPFSWQLLRSTCATYLVNAPSIFGAAAPFLAAKMLGHSVTVAEKHYAGVLRGLPRDATTLERCMQVESEVKAILAALDRRAQVKVVAHA